MATYEDSYYSYVVGVSSYYRVPEREVIIIHDRGIAYDDLPVVYYLADRCNQSPDVIVDLRLGGMSWIDITWRFGATAEVFYVPMREPVGPYRTTYSRFREAETGKNTWKSVRLRDADVVNQVNLQFISKQYNQKPEEVAKVRSGKSNFVKVHDEVKKGKAKPEKPKKEKAPRGRGRGTR